MTRRRVWMCAALGLTMTVAPILLIELTGQPGNDRGAVEDALSVLTGPGVLVSRPLFGVHNLGFFVVAPLLNFLFWSAACYICSELYARLRKGAH